MMKKPKPISYFVYSDRKIDNLNQTLNFLEQDGWKLIKSIKIPRNKVKGFLFNRDLLKIKNPDKIK